MHKIQKTLISLLAFSSFITPFAQSHAAGETDFYLTIGGGLIMGNKQGASSFESSESNTTTDSSKSPPVTTTITTDTKANASFKKPKNGGELLAGVGYKVMDNLRLEAVFVKPWFGKSNTSLTVINTVTHQVQGHDPVEEEPTITNLTGKTTAQINSLQLRAYFDAFELGEVGKAYVGAGLGWSQVKAKFSCQTNAQSFTTKNKNNLSFFVGVGAFFSVTDGLKLAVEYNYQDFGKAKKPSDNFNLGKKSFAGSAVIAKIMFDI